jgi:hypothetical protein
MMLSRRWKSFAACIVLAQLLGGWVVPNMSISGIYYHPPLEELLKFAVAYLRPAATLAFSALWFGVFEGFLKVMFGVLTFTRQEIMTLDGGIAGLLIVVTSLFHVLTGYTYFRMRAFGGKIAAVQLAANTLLHGLMNWSQEQLDPNGLANLGRRATRDELLSGLAVNLMICGITWCVFCMIRAHVRPSTDAPSPTT